MKIIVDSIVLEYKDEGAGRALLFLHGWQDNLHSFDSVSLALNSEYRLIRLDMPGFGESEDPGNSWDLDKYISFVNKFIEKLNLDIYAIIGHSFGGRIIIKGVANNAVSAQKIILIASAGIAKRKTFKNYFFKFMAKMGGLVTYIPPLLFYREFLRKKMYSFIGNDYINAGMLKDTFIKVINEDLTNSAEKLKVPTLLIWGADDAETPLSDGKRLSTLISNSQLEIIEDCGHFVHKQKPKEVAELIKKFL